VTPAGAAAAAGAPGDPPPLRLADPALLFEGRAARFRQLAAGHAAPEWLALLAQLAQGQAAAVREIRPVPPPDRPPHPASPRGGEELRKRSIDPGPPLAADRIARDGAWRRMLAVILAAIRTEDLPPEAQVAVGGVAALAADELETLAGGLLGGAFPRERAASAPFVGAALQAWLAALAAGLDPRAFAPSSAACPVCGGPPVAGVVQGSDRLRYVTCALCTAEWNVVRARCVSCDTVAAPEYFHVEGQQGAKAEACPSCRSYLKLFDQLARPGADAAADDAATIALDLMLAEDGWQRAGPNLYVSAG
jgi:FdhE protein